MLLKAIIPAAGLGTRLLPATKEQPKEMLPIITQDENGELFLTPFLQVVFEQLYEADIREICFIVGRGKRSIEDHFTVDDEFLESLKLKNKYNHYHNLNNFYKKVRDSTIIFINQPQPLGLADAIYCGKFVSQEEAFIVHAGDDLILSKTNYIKRLVSVFEKYKADAVFFIQKVKDPSRYGVVMGQEITEGLYHVKKVIEKPSKPPSNLAIIAIYIFNSKIYKAIEKIEPGVNNEIQITDAIQFLINQGDLIYAVELGIEETRIDIGDPSSYKDAFTAKII